MDTTAQWPQDLVKPMEENNSSTTGRPQNQQQLILERRVRPQKEQALHCPRCNSTNTKFCYYNNYSLTQPRYFCKTCRRYWTEGGSLRNVPVGGGSRKNKRSSSSSSSSSTATATAAATTTSLPSVLSSDQNPKFHEGQDLNLAFRLPEFSAHDHFPNMGSNCASAADPLSAMELLRSTGGISNRPGINIPFMPMASMPTAEYQSGFGAHDYMRSNTLSFPNLDAVGERMQGAQDSEQRLLFPFEDSSRQQQNGGGNPPGFWNGMLGSGGGGGSGSCYESSKEKKQLSRNDKARMEEC